MARYEDFDEETKRIFNVITYVGAAIFFLFFALLTWARSYPVVWRSTTSIDILKSIAFASLIFTFCVVFFVIKTSRRNIPRQHQWILVYYSVLFLGFPILCSSTQLGLIMNGLLDFSKPKTFQTSVVSARTIAGGRKTRRSWQMQIKDWRVSSDTIKISITKQEYDAINIGSPIRVVTKSGFLGYEWIVNRSFGITARGVVSKGLTHCG